MKNIADSISKGIVGTSGAIIATVTSAQEHLTWILGVVVATLSAISLLVDIIHKLRKPKP